MKRLESELRRASSVFRMDLLRATRVTSPDVRSGHPWPPLTRRNLRFALRAALAFYAGSITRVALSLRWREAAA